MTSLRDEVAADSRPGRQECSVETFLTTQPNPNDKEPITRETWEEVLADASLTHRAIYRAMKRRGYALSDQPIERHRNGECRCARAA